MSEGQEGQVPAAQREQGAAGVAASSPPAAGAAGTAALAAGGEPATAPQRLQHPVAVRNPRIHRLAQTREALAHATVGMEVLHSFHDYDKVLSGISGTPTNPKEIVGMSCYPTCPMDDWRSKYVVPLAELPGRQIEVEGSVRFVLGDATLPVMSCFSRLVPDRVPFFEKYHAKTDGKLLVSANNPAVDMDDCRTGELRFTWDRPTHGSIYAHCEIRNDPSKFLFSSAWLEVPREVVKFQSTMFDVSRWEICDDAGRNLKNKFVMLPTCIRSHVDPSGKNDNVPQKYQPLLDIALRIWNLAVAKGTPTDAATLDEVIGFCLGGRDPTPTVASDFIELMSQYDLDNVLSPEQYSWWIDECREQVQIVADGLPKSDCVVSYRCRNPWLDESARLIAVSVYQADIYIYQLTNRMTDDEIAKAIEDHDHPTWASTADIEYVTKAKAYHIKWHNPPADKRLPDVRPGTDAFKALSTIVTTRLCLSTATVRGRPCQRLVGAGNWCGYHYSNPIAAQHQDSPVAGRQKE